MAEEARQHPSADRDLSEARLMRIESVVVASARYDTEDICRSAVMPAHFHTSQIHHIISTGLRPVVCNSTMYHYIRISTNWRDTFHETRIGGALGNVPHRLQLPTHHKT
jgi:hypothetical protein